jgi:subtilisin family serine protease
MKILSRKNKCLEKNNNMIQFFQMIHSNTNIKMKRKNTGFLAVFIIVSVLCSMSTAYAELPSEVKTDESIIDNIQSSDLNESSFLSNRFLIKVEDTSRKTIKESLKSEDTGIDTLNNLNKKYGVLKFEPLVKHKVGSKKDSPLSNWYIVTLKTPKEKITKKSDQFVKFKEILDSYQNDPNIKVVEPDYLVNILTIPDDPYYSSSGSWGQSYPDLWGIHKINSEYAWDQTVVSPSIIVADIDTGVDRNHEDLRDNMWVNTGEVPDNGIDDDGNGYVDDYYGWDWVNDDNDPMDDHGHGTHCAGTIAAVGNNSIGVVGVSPNSKIMALKFLNSGGSGYLSDAVKALRYAADMGARVSSNSWGGSGTSPMLDDAIQYVHDQGMVVVVAAGNSNADALDFTPASSDRAITVAASDYNDAKASFSNWGQKIDVAAPGVDILSTKAAVCPMCNDDRTVGTYYCRVSGTSMATPHVAGLAALILSMNPDLTNEDVRQLIRTGAVDLGAQGKDRDFGYGRIDADGSVSLSAATPLAPMITSPWSRTVVYGQALRINGSVLGPDFASYTVEAGAGRDPGTWETLATSTSQVINGTLATVDTTQLKEGIHIFRLTAIGTDGKPYQFQIHDIEVDNFDTDIVYPVSLATQGNIDVLGSAQTKNGLLFDHYTLEWGEGNSPAVYSNSGVALTNDGQQPVNNNNLGTWDTSGLTHGQVYTLRLTVTADNGIASQYTTTLTLDTDLVSGWPKLISKGSSMISEATPTIADLDNDGVSEVILTSPGNKIYVFRKDGTDFPGFPISVTEGECFTWPANAADLDNDGNKEIIAAAVTSSGTSKVYIIRSDGTFYPGWPQPVHVIAQRDGDGTPTIADLDGDGNKDLVVIDPYYKKMHAYQLDGSELAGFPKTLPFDTLEFPGVPAIVDLDNDGNPEIAYGLKDKFYLFDNQGNVLSGWPFVAPLYNGRTINFESAPATGDIDGDGNLEVIAIAHDGGATSPVYAWKKDGSLVPNWPMDAGSVAYGHSPMNSPAVADVDNDGKDEVVTGLRYIQIFDLKGAKPIGSGISAKIAPAISDVDGDGRSEFSGVGDNKVLIGNDDGSLYWERVFSTGAVFFSPAVFSDLDNNGRMELTVIQGRFSSEDGDLVAYLWELPETSTNAANGWPMFLHDMQRSGRLSVSDPVDTIQPTTSVTSPLDASTVSGTLGVVILASDNFGVSRVDMYRNNVLVGTKTSTPFTFSWDTTPEENGQYSLQSKAYDASGNVGTSPLITVYVENSDPDTIAPAVSITSPLDQGIVSGTLDVVVSASDNFGVSRVDMYRNNVLVGTKTSAPFTFSWDTTHEENGQYSLQSKAYDASGNVGTSSLITVDVENSDPDTIAPAVSITSPLDQGTVPRKSTVTITASASDNTGVTKVEFYVNGVLECTDTTDSYTYSWKVVAKPNVVYRLQAKAYDATGNVGSSALIEVTSK